MISFYGGSSRSHCVESWHWKRLWTCPNVYSTELKRVTRSHNVLTRKLFGFYGKIIDRGEGRIDGAVYE